jgi:hypothetical protein
MIDFPANPTVGQTFTSGGVTWTWDGVKWTFGGSVGPPVTISPTPPSGALPGALWWDSVGGQLYLYFYDGNSSQWVIAVNTANLIPEAPTDGNLYGRENASWVAVPPTTGFLPLIGGTLTGPLALAPPSTAPPTLTLNKSALTQINQVFGQTNGVNRWALLLGDGSNETGSNLGSNLQIVRYSDAGAFLAQTVQIARSTGLMTVAGGITTNGVLTALGGIQATGPTSIQGTTQSDSAAAGNIGEVISSVVTTPVTLTSSTPTQVTSVALTPGDWDLNGEVWLQGTGTLSNAFAAINLSVAIPTVPGLINSRNGTSTPYPAGSITALPMRPCRISIAATTTYFLVAQMGFTTTGTATGVLWARRMR